MTDVHNPYSPPKANVEDAQGPDELEPVGKGKRFGTYLIDYLIINLVMFVVGAVAAAMFGESGVSAMTGLSGIGFSLLAYIAYYAVFEGLWARTPAKFMLGTKVVLEDGSQPAFGKIMIRTLCRLIPFEPFSFFGVRGWHDGISDTWVVPARG